MCSSKKDNDTASDLLTQSVWIATINYEDLDLDGTFVEFGDDCEKDDQWNFTNNEFEFFQNAGPVSCDTDTEPNAIIAQGNWELRDNDQQLVLKFIADEIVFEIRSITEIELVLDLVEANNPSGTFTQRLILKR